MGALKLWWLLARCRGNCVRPEATRGTAAVCACVRVGTNSPGEEARKLSSSFVQCLWHFFFIPSVLLVSYIVIVHQRSFYSGAEDDAR